MLNEDKIQQELTSRFAAPLPEFYKRRIIFWYDEDREFENKIGNISLQNARILILTGSNFFITKRILEAEDTTSNFLVYCPLRYDKPEDDWLLNIELYSEEFRADLNSIWISEMGLPANSVMRQMVKKYRKFFNEARWRKSVASMAKEIQTASRLHLAVMASLCGLKKPDPSDIIRTLLAKSLDPAENSIYQNFAMYGAQEPFWVMVSQGTGFTARGEDADLGQLAVHLFLTAATRTIRQEFLSGLEARFSLSHQAYCYDLVSEWLVSDAQSVYRIARFVEEETRLADRFSRLEIEDLIETEIFPCINECILKMMMTQITDSIIQPDAIRGVVEKRRTKVWYAHFSYYYEGLLALADMQAFFLSHAAGFHLAEPRQVWEAYLSDYYQMDSAYRHFHLVFGRSLSVSNGELDDLFKQVAEQAEALYSGWFLTELCSNWTNVCGEELQRYGRILDASQQEFFYRFKVASSSNRVYVIISDALRYEVAAELVRQLRQETQCKAELTGMEAIFPTTSNFGLAALLPHNELSIVRKDSGGVAVLADGKTTEMADREGVLKRAHAASVALQYKEIIKMKRAERQALVKGMDIVYIYHDKIDEASHTSDNLVFSACEDAIAEIKNMVRIICNEFGGAHILITADHGFLYTYSPLREDAKVGKDSFQGRDVEVGRRYAIVEQDAEPEFLLPVKFMGESVGLRAYTPRENLRLKTGGGGLNYVHGGISLQEVAVPLIDYQYLRNDYKTYQRNREKYETKPVRLTLLSTSRKISNLIFSLNFFQREEVCDNRAACTYLVYMVDAEGNKISDTNRIIADKTSENVQERTFRCGFNLKSRNYGKGESYYLVIADESGLQAPQKEEFQIDIPMAFDEFSFFEK